MRTSPILGDGPCSYYHVLSRVIERRFIPGEQEQEHFWELMRTQEAFSGADLELHVEPFSHAGGGGIGGKGREVICASNRAKRFFP